jgi:hypothetical protein
MSMLKFNITMSLDGYVAGPNQSVAHPLGEGGEQLHDWAFATRTFRAVHGMEGGATGPDDDIAAEYFQNIGATIMAATCLAAATARGEIILGMGGGEKIRRSTCLSSFSRITPAIRLR